MADTTSEAAASDADEALKRIVSWVNVSERSERSVRERLERESYDEASIEEALERAKSYGYIDDMRFASMLVRSRLSQKKGIDGIRRELQVHAIDLEAVPGWPEEFLADDFDEVASALDYLDKHPTRSKNKREGAYRKLVQRGYSSSTAATAARQWAERFS